MIRLQGTCTPDYEFGSVSMHSGVCVYVMMFFDAVGKCNLYATVH